MLRLNDTTLEPLRYPNGEIRVDAGWIQRAIAKCSRHHLRLQYKDEADLILLMFVKRHLDMLRVENVGLVIDYMPYSRMDRSVNGSVFTLRYVTELINALNFSWVYILEPHSDVTCALLNHSQAVQVVDEMIVCAQDKHKLSDGEICLIYPDAGAQKRYQQHKFPELTCLKKRDFETGKIVSMTLNGRCEKPYFTAIIVDDLCSYGNTFAQAAELLREAGAVRVFLCVTHCENSIYSGPIVRNGGLIDGVITTDSILGGASDDLIEVIPCEQIWRKLLEGNR